MLYAKNDNSRLKRELTELQNKNRPLYDLIIDLYKWVENQFDKDVIMTMIYRTQQEQELIYGEGTEKKSPHQFWQGLDLRSWIYTEKEIDAIVNYLNSKYNDSNYYGTTAMCHKVKEGAYHFHIQYYKT